MCLIYEREGSKRSGKWDNFLGFLVGKKDKMSRHIDFFARILEWSPAPCIFIFHVFICLSDSFILTLTQISLWNNKNIWRNCEMDISWMCRQSQRSVFGEACKHRWKGEIVIALEGGIFPWLWLLLLFLPRYCGHGREIQ